MFNTLGNLAVNPSVGLLFVDFDTGSRLQITGKAEIIWDSSRFSPMSAERGIAVIVEEVVQIDAG
jgi:uncharacterized protein